MGIPFLPTTNQPQAVNALWRLVAGGASRRRPPCPHCGAAAGVGWGRFRDRPRYRCRRCRRTYTARTGTVLAGTRYPERLAAMPWCLLDGLTVREAGQRLGVHFTTTFRWRHRLLARLHAGAYPRLRDGPVQVVQALVRCSRKGIHGSRRPHGPSGLGLDSARGRPEDGVRVLLACGTRGEVRYAVWGRDCELGPVEAAIRAMVRPGVPVIAERLAYLIRRGTPRRRGAGRRREAGWLRHREPPQPPLFRVTGLVVQLAWWLARFCGVAARYLHHYLAWFAIFARPADGAALKATPA